MVLLVYIGNLEGYVRLKRERWMKLYRSSVDRGPKPEGRGRAYLAYGVIKIITCRQIQDLSHQYITTRSKGLTFYLPPLRTSPSLVIPLINFTLPSNQDVSISSAPVANIFDPTICSLRILVLGSTPAPAGMALKEGGRLRKGLYTADRSN